MSSKDVLIQIDDEIDTKFEACNVLRKHPKNTVLLPNIKGHNIQIVSGICNTREKIAKAINCEVPEITDRIIKATENPLEIKNFKTLEEYDTMEADLSKLPILTHYKKDGGAYITAGVVIAKNPETGVQNASIHRMLVLENKKLVIRLVPRNLYTYFEKSKEKGENLKIAIAIGMDPAILLASTTSIGIDDDEMEVANALKDGELELIHLEDSDLNVPDADILLEGEISIDESTKEGPFVDLTDTYDVIRKQPIINLKQMHIKKENPMYHAILPAGFEHKLLQGLPQEPRIYKAIKNMLPTVQNVVLTEGGCCWLHAVVSIKKQTQGDAKNVMMAALSAHPSLKHVVVVDEDIDIFNVEDVEYAIATRVKGDEDVFILPGARGSSLDPVAEEDGTTTKIGIDATKNLRKKEKFERVSKEY